MTDQTCKDCGRPLMAEDDEYCPDCRAKRAGKFGKYLGIGSAVGTTLAAIAGAVIFILKVFVKRK